MPATAAVARGRIRGRIDDDMPDLSGKAVIEDAVRVPAIVEFAADSAADRHHKKAFGVKAFREIPGCRGDVVDQVHASAGSRLQFACDVGYQIGRRPKDRRRGKKAATGDDRPGNRKNDGVAGIASAARGAHVAYDRLQNRLPDVPAVRFAPKVADSPACVRAQLAVARRYRESEMRATRVYCNNGHKTRFASSPPALATSTLSRRRRARHDTRRHRPAVRTRIFRPRRVSESSTARLDAL